MSTVFASSGVRPGLLIGLSDMPEIRQRTEQENKRAQVPLEAVLASFRKWGIGLGSAGLAFSGLTALLFRHSGKCATEALRNKLVGYSILSGALATTGLLLGAISYAVGSEGAPSHRVP